MAIRMISHSEDWTAGMQTCELATEGEDRIFYCCNQNKPPSGDGWESFVSGPDFWVWSKPAEAQEQPS